MTVMQLLLTFLIVICALGAVGALARGIYFFLKTTEHDLMGTGPSASSLKQNKMMRARIMFQAAAVIFVVFLLLLSGRG